jgi:uncharacterized protein
MNTTNRLSLSNKLLNWNPLSIGFTLTLYLLSISLPIASALIVLWWRKYTKTSYAEIGLAKPPNWLITILVGTLIGIVVKIIMKSLIMPLAGAPPLNEAFQFIYQDLGKLILYICLSILFAGFGEEMVVRGFFFSRFKTFLGDSILGRLAIIFMTATIFAIPHSINQGFYGLINAGLVAIIFGIVYFASKKNLWQLMIAHSVYDTFSFIVIYLGKEAALSELFF